MEKERETEREGGREGGDISSQHIIKRQDKHYIFPRIVD